MISTVGSALGQSASTPINVGLASKSGTHLAATHQFRMYSLSIRPAGCETGFTFAYEAAVKTRMNGLAAFGSYRTHQAREDYVNTYDEAHQRG